MMVITAFLDPILNPALSSFGTLWFVIFISFLVSLITTVVYKYTTDQIMMKHHKEELDKLQKKLKESMHDQSKSMSLQKQMWERQMVMMKHSLTSTFITLLPILVLFTWLRGHLGTEKILNLGFTSFGWLGSYILFAIIFSMILRKLLKVY